MAPEHRRVFGDIRIVFGDIRPIRHFWSVEQHSKSAEFTCFGFWPNGLRVTIRHTFFDIFAKGCIRIQTLIVHT